MSPRVSPNFRTALKASVEGFFAIRSRWAAFFAAGGSVCALTAGFATGRCAAAGGGSPRVAGAGAVTLLSCAGSCAIAWGAVPRATGSEGAGACGAKACGAEAVPAWALGLVAARGLLVLGLAVLRLVAPGLLALGLAVLKLVAPRPVEPWRRWAGCPPKAAHRPCRPPRQPRPCQLSKRRFPRFRARSLRQPAAARRPRTAGPARQRR